MFSSVSEHWECAEIYQLESPAWDAKCEPGMNSPGISCVVVCVARTLVPRERRQGNAFFCPQMSLELAF